MEGDGQVGEYVGGYSDWETHAHAARRKTQRPTRSAAAAAAPASATTRETRARKLGYREQRELDALPGLIESLETELAAVQRHLGDPRLYREARGEVARLKAQLVELESRVAEAYARWDELESAAR